MKMNNDDQFKWNAKLHEKWLKEQEEEQQRKAQGRFNASIQSCFKRWKRKMIHKLKSNKGVMTKVEVEAMFEKLESELKLIIGQSPAMQNWLDQTIDLLHDKLERLFHGSGGVESPPASGRKKR